MHHRRSTRLALVANGPEPHPERNPRGAADAPHPIDPDFGTETSPDRIPFAVSLTMAQIYQVAEDAEIRAKILDDVAFALGRRTFFIRRVNRPDLIERRVSSLREVAGALREVADQLLDAWAEPEPVR